MTVTELPQRFRETAEFLRRTAAAEQAATAWEGAATELEEALREEANEALNLQEAARESGYSVSALGKMVREGRIRNVGRKNAPKIRRADLPRKPTGLAPRGRADSSIGRIVEEAAASRGG